MKIKIRRNVFETNSSSTHSICITKSNRSISDCTEKYENVNFVTGEFGWENEIYKETASKATYQYTAIAELGNCNMINKKKCIDFITKTLFENNISCTFTEGDYYYIDHCGELVDFVNSVCHSQKRLLKYLFSDESFIITGNDNDDNCDYISVTYKHEEYYKGN